MTEIFAILFTIGGILGFLTMLFHSYYTSDSEDLTIFIFGGGFILAYMLEYTLIHLFHAYSYTNLPLMILEVPIVIPMGWVVTFYGLSAMAKDLLDQHNLRQSIPNRITTTGVLAVFFGMGIEILARNINFWVFYFDSVEIVGVPIIVTLAWGLSVATFVLGVELFKIYSKWWWLIMIVVQLLNTGIALLLFQFTSIG